MHRRLLFWVAGLVVVAFAIAASAQQNEETAEKKGVEATYKNEVMRFDLDGKTGKLYYKCGRCGKWHSKDLTLVKKTTFTWKASDESFTGWVYKARGEDRWYFLSDDTVSITLGGKTVERYPIASSTTSSSKNFYRIKTTGGTTREIRAFANVPVTTEPEKGAKDPETFKDTGEEKK